MAPRPRGPQIRGDPRAEFLTRLAGALGGGWLERRRFLREIEHHLEDSVEELRQAGVTEDEALADAMARLGDVDAIAGAFRAARSTRPRPWRRVARVPVAWIAVGAMSIVTIAAAELPQASGAKVPEFRVAPQRPMATGPRHHPKIRVTCRCSRDIAHGRWQN